MFIELFDDLTSFQYELTLYVCICLLT